jgi:hypothetical protein
MSSAGHVMDSIKRMKANRALTTRRDAFNIKEANSFRPKASSEIRKYRFKEATPQYLRKLKSQLSTEKKRELIKQIIVLIISISLGIIIFL